MMQRGRGSRGRGRGRHRHGPCAELLETQRIREEAEKEAREAAVIGKAAKNTISKPVIDDNPGKAAVPEMEKPAESNFAEQVAENPEEENAEDTVSEECSDETSSEEESVSDSSSDSASKTLDSLDSAGAAREEFECSSAAKNKEASQPAVKVFDKMPEQVECSADNAIQKETSPADKVFDRMPERGKPTEIKEKQAPWTNTESSGSRTDAEVEELYDSWLVQHDKSYNGIGEKETRFEIFKENLRYIDEYNRVENRRFKLGLNRFADLTNEEYRNKYLGVDMKKRGAVVPLPDSVSGVLVAATGTGEKEGAEIDSDNNKDEEANSEAEDGNGVSFSAAVEFDETLITDGVPQLKTSKTGDEHNVFDKGTEPASTSWVSKFKDNRKLTTDLKLHSLEHIGSDELEDGDLTDIDKEWGYPLIGFVSGRFPGLKAIRTLCGTWGVKYNLLPHESGWIIFKFESEEDRSHVLEGNWMVFGRQLLLKIMPKNFDFGDEDIRSVPVWIQLPSLPLSCWNTRALSKIASKVGKPLAMDRLTQSKERVSFARVLVEVDAANPLKEEFIFRLPGGKEITQKVRFEFKPKYCHGCRGIGHDDSSCKHQLKGTLRRGTKDATSPGPFPFDPSNSRRQQVQVDNLDQPNTMRIAGATISAVERTIQLQGTGQTYAEDLEAVRPASGQDFDDADGFISPKSARARRRERLKKSKGIAAS